MRLKGILILLAIALALGGYYYFSSRPEPAPAPEPRPQAWSVPQEKIHHIAIKLPREGKSQAFFKNFKEAEEGKYPWHFDDPRRSEVNRERWGGGIPLLSSGPKADRLIAKDATEEKLAEFGLTQPQMEVILTLKNGDSVDVIAGDSTLDGGSFYIKTTDSNDVYLVDHTWYEVFERLVKEPPYIPAWSISEEEIQHIVIKLPREGKSQAFYKDIKEAKEGKFPWHFDDPQSSRVNRKRWKEGLSFLLSGPKANKIIAEDATEEKLAEFGLTQPQMEVILTLKNGDSVDVIAGDSTLDGSAFYIKTADSNDVYPVDHTWYEVVERLAKDPPYVPSSD